MVGSSVAGFHGPALAVFVSCPVLAHAIAVLNCDLPHLRGHSGFSLLLVRGSPGAAMWFSARTCTAPFP